jgi:Tol biopolymer transport system component/DNA-binding winged helix-turn-helix (wHTH) protein
MAESAQYRFDRFMLDPIARVLRRDGEPVQLTPKVMETLVVLVRNHGRLVTKDSLLAELWPDTVVEEANLVQNIYSLRKALGEKPDEHRFIVTAPGRGYTFVAPVVEIPSGGVRPAGKADWKRRRAWLALTGVAAVIAAVALMRGVRREPIPWRVTPLTAFPGIESWPAFSPDGRQVVFAWNGEKADNWDIYTVLAGTASLLRLTQNPAWEGSPAWSPDGRSVAFLRCCREAGGVFIVPALGGVERKVGDAALEDAEERRLDWSGDSQRLVLADRAEGESRLSLFELDLASGGRRRLTSPQAQSIGDTQPAVSPDGRRVAFARVVTAAAMDIYVMSVSGGPARRVTFDEQMIQGLAWTSDGKELVFGSTREGPPALWRIASSGGQPRRLAAAGEESAQPAVARAGGRLAYVQLRRDVNLYRVDLRHPGGAPQAFLPSTRIEAGPQYSPAGERIAFYSDRSGTFEIWVASSDGAGTSQRTAMGGPLTASPCWSPDGKRIAFDSHAAGNADIWVVDAGGGAPRRVTSSQSEDVMPAWSRDGSWIYYSSIEGGVSGIRRIRPEGGESEWLTRSGGWRPLESPDRRWIYNSHDGALHRFPADGGPESLVVRGFSSQDWGYYAVTNRGLYYLDRAGKQIMLLDPERGAARRVIALDRLPGPSHRSYALAVSPDHRWLIYSLVDGSNGDLKLVDGFR